MDTVLTSETLKHRMKHMSIFLAVSEGMVIGTVACGLARLVIFFGTPLHESEKELCV